MKCKFSGLGGGIQALLLGLSLVPAFKLATAQCYLPCTGGDAFYDDRAGRLRFEVTLTTSGSVDGYPSGIFRESWGFSSWTWFFTNENGPLPMEQGENLFRDSIGGCDNAGLPVNPGQTGLFAVSHCSACKYEQNESTATSSDFASSSGESTLIEAGGYVFRMRQIDAHEGGFGSCTSNSGIGGAFSHSEVLFADLFPASDTTTIRISARIDDNGTTCKLQSKFPLNEKLRACAIITTAGGYSHASKFTIFNDKIDSGDLEMLDRPTGDLGYCWTKSITLSEEVGSPRRLGVGASVDTFIFTDEMFDFLPDVDPSVIEFNEADVNWLEANVVGNFDSSSPNYCKRPYWLYRANLVPEDASYQCGNTSFLSSDVIDAADVAALRMLINIDAFTPKLGDADRNGEVNCADWLDPTVSSNWTNPLTMSDWQFGESGYKEALDYNRDGVMSTSATGDRYYHYRNLNRADFNGDGMVDDADFVIFFEFYDELAAGGDLNCDTNGSNNTPTADDADFVIFMAAYNALECTHINCGSAIPVP